MASTHTNLLTFDVIQFLSSRGVSNKQQTRGAVNIHCPFCHDEGHHLGIFLDHKNWNCWKCGQSGSFYDLCKVLFHLSYTQYKDLVSRSGIKISNPVQQVHEIFNPRTAVTKPSLESLPAEAIRLTEQSIQYLPLISAFLDKRKLSLADCIRRHAHFCMTGKYANRLIIPIIIKGKTVGFQGRDLTQKAEAKYLTGPDGIDVSQYVYGIDGLRTGDICCVEGIFDQWPIEEQAVCCFGSSISPAQQKILLGRKLTSLTILFDEDIFHVHSKLKKIHSVAALFISVGIPVRIVRLPVNEDPSSLGRERTLTEILKWRFEDAATLRCRYLQDYSLDSRTSSVS